MAGRKAGVRRIRHKLGKVPHPKSARARRPVKPHSAKGAGNAKRAKRRAAGAMHVPVPKAAKGVAREYVKTGIAGLDGLLEKGIPKNSSIIIAGGAGSGKTLMGLQILANAARGGKKSLYMSFEESEERLRQHMEDFGWGPRELERKGSLMIKRLSIFDIRRSLDALMAKSEGELFIDVMPIILPAGFKPDLIVLDSLTAIASAFKGDETYRSYIEHLFRYLESMSVTSFLITETEQVPVIFSPTGVEEFLADGVIVLYNIRKGDIRESAIEVLKMRGGKHMKKVVAMQVVSNAGIEVYPDQEVFSGIK